MFEKVINNLFLMFIGMSFMVKIPSIFIPEDMLKLGWNALLFINFLGSYMVVTDMVNTGEFKRPVHFLKAVLLMPFWFLFVDWKGIFWGSKDKNN